MSGSSWHALFSTRDEQKAALQGIVGGLLALFGVTLIITAIVVSFHLGYQGMDYGESLVPNEQAMMGWASPAALRVLPRKIEGRGRRYEDRE